MILLRAPQEAGCDVVSHRDVHGIQYGPAIRQLPQNVSGDLPFAEGVAHDCVSTSWQCLIQIKLAQRCARKDGVTPH